MPSLNTPIQHSTGSPSHSNQKRRKNERYLNWEGETKMVIIHGWHDSVHRKPYKLHQKTTPPKKCEFSKEVGYKVNIQKLIAFLYTNNEISERETKKKIPLTTASSTTKRMYLEINLTKEVKNLCLENYRALKKEIRKVNEMKAYTMFMEQKNEHHQNVHTTQNNL